MKPLELSITALAETSTLSHLPSPPSNNGIGANNDVEAIAIFLQARGGRSEHTLRRYQRECQRFLAWLNWQQGITLKQLTLKDLQQYYPFLQAPPSHWRCAPNQASYTIAELFPFPVKKGSGFDNIMRVIASLLSFLHQQGYLDRNPASGMQKLGEKYAQGHGSQGAYSLDEWSFICHAVQRLPKSTQRQQLYYERARYFISIAYGTAAREHELCTHTHDSIYKTDFGYTWEVLGKGSARRNIPLNDMVMESIYRFRRIHGAPEQLTAFDTFPFAPSVKPIKQHTPLLYGNNISTRQLRTFYKSLIISLIEQQAGIDSHMAQSIVSKGFHALRHTALTHLLNQHKLDLEKVRVFAGHSNVNTTAGYILTEREELAKQTQYHGLDWI
ncbi:tyrosine-type recombinase/integrase [Zooshikella marina]|uniref:tyrosine-type recombinase/integrase n=1 Tax=Zooshikella ganghwensis TaxID=202772 RepID=UPI001BAE75F8|nr:tyrosine-type recombinase/integrase [Zooshikella ganghwensis]MBU2708300.1 tyrosine-type recombinase/integrase [Zooshikella ganghwensis]